MKKVTSENVQEYLARYMEGESTQEEQRLLKEYFGNTKDLPADLRPYAQMFVVLEERPETPSVEALDRFSKGQIPAVRRSVKLWPLVAAACVAASTMSHGPVLVVNAPDSAVAIPVSILMVASAICSFLACSKPSSVLVSIIPLMAPKMLARLEAIVVALLIVCLIDSFSSLAISSEAFSLCLAYFSLIAVFCLSYSSVSAVVS